jgi:Trk K+ transport system NAD-binding subunit
MTRSAEADMFIKSTPNVALPRPGLAVLEAADALPYRCLRGHVIVCGLHPLGLRIVEVLRSSAVPVVVVDDDPDPRLVSILGRWDIPHIAETPRLPEVLINAGLDGARAVVSVEADDLQNLETALIVRSLRPNVRIIVQMSNAAVGAAVSHLVTSGAALDVAALAAPSLVQACLGGGQLDLDLAGQRFAVTETVVTRPGTLRSIYGDLVPIAVIAPRAPVEICPGRDHPVHTGDRVSVLGTAPDLTETLGGRRATIASAAPRPSRVSTGLHAIRSVAQGAGRRVGALMVAVVGLVATSTLILSLGYNLGRGRHLSVLNSLYFTVETISTVGYGDFSFGAQSPGLRVFGIILIILGAAAITALFALITDLLLSRRVADAFGLRRVTGMSGHVVVVGLGAVGFRVVEELHAYGLPVVVIESDEHNRHLPSGRALRVPVIVGDATQTPTLDAAHVTAASAVAILTSNDLTNLETGLSLRQHLRSAGREIPIIMRVFDRPLGRVIEDSFGFRLVRSTSALAAPWFVGAALGLDILSTFYIEQELLLVACLTVAPAGGLAGLAMQDLSARIRVIAIRRSDASALEYPPRRATRFGPGDRAYLIGPYQELLAVLQRDARNDRSATTSS